MAKQVKNRFGFNPTGGQIDNTYGVLCRDTLRSIVQRTTFAENEVPQTFIGLSEATKKLLKLVVSGGVHHGGHPVLAHHASCLALKSDGNDLVKPIKPDREKEASRIDLIAACINALSRAMVQSAKPAPLSLTKGFITL